MRALLLAAVLVAGSGAPAAAAGPAPRPMVAIPGGKLEPFFSPVTETVAPFRLDKYPVTNAEYLAFVRAHPAWRRGAVSPLLADPDYLTDWAGPDDFGPVSKAGAPVVRVSWFAALAYCKAEGKTLPTTTEWEFAVNDAGRDEEGLRAALLRWHAEPNPAAFPPVTSSTVNGYGAAGLTGLVWEWTYDFNAVMLGDRQSANFCGAGALKSRDTTDYPRFLRFAFRDSLQASFALPNLGFRCAAP